MTFEPKDTKKDDLRSLEERIDTASRALSTTVHDEQLGQALLGLYLAESSTDPCLKNAAYAGAAMQLQGYQASIEQNIKDGSANGAVGDYLNQVVQLKDYARSKCDYFQNAPKPKAGKAQE